MGFFVVRILPAPALFLVLMRMDWFNLPLFHSAQSLAAFVPIVLNVYWFRRMVSLAAKKLAGKGSDGKTRSKPAGEHGAGHPTPAGADGKSECNLRQRQIADESAASTLG